MYQPKFPFELPDNQNLKIWRYMDLAKFISLLSSRSLYFTRSDLFEDKWEGENYITKDYAEKYLQSYSDPFEEIGISKELLELMSPQLSDVMVDGAKYHRLFKKYMFINCWFLNEFESAGMWDLYAYGPYGIAVQSSISRLITSITDEHSIGIGKVFYNAEPFIVQDNSLRPFLTKRPSFSHEKEIRCIYEDHFDLDLNTMDLTKQEKTGIPIKTDLKVLIENIYISPKSPIWFKELIMDLIKRYQFEFSVIKSSIYDNPE